MRCILDTHAFLWFVKGDPRLKEHPRDLISNDGNERFLSVVSLWEMAIKTSLGRLVLPLSISELAEKQVLDIGMEILPILPGHLDNFTLLPFHHKDPFDRLIIAQAMADDLSIISCDKAFSSYDVPVLWDNHA